MCTVMTVAWRECRVSCDVGWVGPRCWSDKWLGLLFFQSPEGFCSVFSMVILINYCIETESHWRCLDAHVWLSAYSRVTGLWEVCVESSHDHGQLHPVLRCQSCFFCHPARVDLGTVQSPCGFLSVSLDIKARNSIQDQWVARENVQESIRFPCSYTGFACKTSDVHGYPLEVKHGLLEKILHLVQCSHSKLIYTYIIYNHIYIHICYIPIFPTVPGMILDWLVVWNMNLICPFSWECHPNWLIFFRGVGIPPTTLIIK